MGEGIVLTCSKCGYEYGVDEGIGFRYPAVYREVVDDIAGGKYGERMKKAYLEATDPRVDAPDHTFLCRKCGHWEVAPGLTVYSRSPVEGKTDSGVKQVAPTPPERLAAYWFPGMLDNSSYRVAASYYHMCPECGKRMHRAIEEEKVHLKCPECGEEPDSDMIVLHCWD